VKYNQQDIANGLERSASFEMIYERIGEELEPDVFFAHPYLSW